MSKAKELLVLCCESEVDIALLNSMLKAAKSVLFGFSDRDQAFGMCSQVAEAIRFVCDHLGIPASLASSEITGDEKEGGHDFVVIDGKVIDFTLNQFFKKPYPVPFITKIGSKEFKEIYNNRFTVNDKAWDWRDSGSENNYAADIISRIKTKG